MALGRQRVCFGRVTAAIGFLCGVLGLIAGTEDLIWKFGSTGWFTGGSLLVLLALFAFVDGAMAKESAALTAGSHVAPEMTRTTAVQHSPLGASPFLHGRTR